MSVSRTCLGAIAGAILPIGMALSSPTWSADEAEFDRLRGLIEPVTANEPYRVAFAAVHFIDDYWKGVAYGILDEAGHAGVEVVRILSAGGYGRLPEQISQLETLAALDLDALIIGAVSFDGLQRPLARLADNGVKIIVMDLTVNTDRAELRVGQDQFQVGEAIGDYLCDRNAQGKVITIPGPAGVEWTAQRLDGVLSVQERCREMDFVGNVFQASTLLEDGLSQASDLLAVHPDADFIYAAAVSLGTGAARAIRTTERGTRVVTSGFTDSTVDLMERGLIEMVISEPGVLLGRLNLQYAVRALNGDDLPGLEPVEGFTYPSYDIPPMPVTLEVLENYDLSWYDVPPADWQVPLSQ